MIGLWGAICPFALLNHTGERVGMRHGLINFANGCLSWLAFPCWLAYVRNLTRQRLGIGGNAREDVIRAVLCPCCTNCQMSNETEHLDPTYQDPEDDFLSTPPPPPPPSQEEEPEPEAHQQQQQQQPPVEEVQQEGVVHHPEEQGG